MGWGRERIGMHGFKNEKIAAFGNSYRIWIPCRSCRVVVECFWTMM